MQTIIVAVVAIAFYQISAIAARRLQRRIRFAKLRRDWRRELRRITSTETCADDNGRRFDAAQREYKAQTAKPVDESAVEYWPPTDRFGGHWHREGHR